MPKLTPGNAEARRRKFFGTKVYSEQFLRHKIEKVIGESGIKDNKVLWNVLEKIQENFQ